MLARKPPVRMVQRKLSIRTSYEAINYGLRIYNRTRSEVRYVEAYSSRTTYQGRVAIIGTALDVSDRKRMDEAFEEERRQLQRALNEVRTLRGITPICASCKKIRDDKGFWNQVEKYVSEHTEAKFSHGICPEYARRLYPQLYEKT